MRSFLLVVLALLVSVDSSPGTASGDELDFSTNPTHDAHVCNGSPSSTFNEFDNEVGYQSSVASICRSFLKFDISAVNSYINAADLRIWFGGNSIRNTPMILELHRVDNTTWTESGTNRVTWNSQTGYTLDQITYVTLNPPITPSDTYPVKLVFSGLEFEARDAQANTNDVLSLAVTAASEGDPNHWCEFISGEAGYPPELRVDRSTCTVTGTVKHGDVPGNPPAPNAFVRVTCQGATCYSQSSSTDSTGKYTITLSTEDGCVGKTANVNAKSTPPGPVTFEGSASQVMQKTENLPNVIDVFVYGPGPNYMEGLNLGPNPAGFDRVGPQGAVDVSSFVLEDAPELVEVNHYSTSLSFDSSKMACNAVTPVSPFTQTFNAQVDNEAGTMSVEASTAGGGYVTIGDAQDPTVLFQITWEVADSGNRNYTTYVTVDSAELNTTAGPMNPSRHRTSYWIVIGAWVIPAVSRWGLLVMVMLMLMIGAMMVKRWGSTGSTHDPERIRPSRRT